MSAFNSKPPHANLHQRARDSNLQACVKQALHAYLDHLGDEKPSDLYDILIAEIEDPLFQVILGHTRGNQSKAASILGLSRGTLRKKLKELNIHAY